MTEHDLISDLYTALGRIMEYAQDGAALRGVYPAKQPQFIAAAKALRHAAVYLNCCNDVARAIRLQGLPR